MLSKSFITLAILPALTLSQIIYAPQTNDDSDDYDLRDPGVSLSAVGSENGRTTYRYEHVETDVDDGVTRTETQIATVVAGTDIYVYSAVPTGTRTSDDNDYISCTFAGTTGTGTCFERNASPTGAPSNGDVDDDDVFTGPVRAIFTVGPQGAGGSESASGSGPAPTAASGGSTSGASPAATGSSGSGSAVQAAPTNAPASGAERMGAVGVGALAGLGALVVALMA